MKVVTTSHTGLSVEHWAERCVTKTLYIADTADPAIKAQAQAFKASLLAVITHYMKNAIKSDRTTLYNLFVKQGHPDMAEILRKL
jgi:hypothetical protein